MTYSGGTKPFVNGHPPQRRTQYALPAATSLRRASCSLARVMMTTLGGSASAMTALSSFPRLHFSQYGRFGTAQTLRAPALEDSKSANNVRNKTFPVHTDERDGCAPATRLPRVNRDKYFMFTPASEALARPLAVSVRPVPVGAGRVDQVRNSPSLSSISAFQRGSL